MSAKGIGRIEPLRLPKEQKECPVPEPRRGEFTKQRGIYPVSKETDKIKKRS